MPNHASAVRTISIGLALVYLMSLLYCRNFAIPQFKAHGIILSIIFALLLISSIGAIGFKEWGRKALIFLNIFVVFYLLTLYILRLEIILASYAFMGCITVLFYTESKTRAEYQRHLQFDRKSILIIDDDPALLKTVKPILLSKGYSVLTASSGEKGLQIAQRQLPDLIVLDVILPGIKGRQVCAQLKEGEATRRIPVIFLTAKDSPDDVKAEMAAGGISHITKPFSSQRLLDEIIRALGV